MRLSTQTVAGACARHPWRAIAAWLALIVLSLAAVATLLPGAPYFGFSAQFAPARQLIDAGVAVTLASGFPRSSHTYNLQLVLAIACDHMRMHLTEAIAACTINAAHAAGVAARKGSLEAGKDADLLVLNIADYREMLCYLGGNLVALTMKRGEVVCGEIETQWPDD